MLDPLQTIREVQPDVVVVELCQYRVSMLKMDEAALLREAKEISLEKLQQAVRQVGCGAAFRWALFPLSPRRRGAQMGPSLWSVQGCPLHPGICVVQDSSCWPMREERPLCTGFQVRDRWTCFSPKPGAVQGP